MSQHDIHTYDLQYWVEFMGDGGEWGDPIRVTEDKEFTPERQRTEQTAQYLCAKNEVRRTVGKTDSFAFTIDAVGPGGIQKELAAIEDEDNVRTRLTRTCAYDFEKGQAAPATALPAKRCECYANLDPMSGSFGELATFSGTITQVGEEWEHGTFDPATGEFTAALPSE